MSAFKRFGAMAILAPFPVLAAATTGACASDTTDTTVDERTVLTDGATDAPDASDAGDARDGAELPDANPCSTSGVCIVETPIDTRINVTSISGSGARDVWAVGTDRTILHYDGSVWEKAAPIQEDAASFTMRGVWAGGASDVWIANGPSILHSNGWKGPNATTWESTILDYPAAVPSAIGGKDGVVMIARQLANQFGAPDAIVACKGWGNGGLLAPEVPDSNPFGGSGTDGLWALTMIRADEAWATSIPTTDDRTGARVLRVVHAIPDAGGGGAPVPTWQFEEHDSRTGKNLYGVWGNEQVVWLVGEGGVLRRTTPANMPTRAFENVPSPVTVALRGVYGFTADDVWAVGDDATILHWDGNAWSTVTSPFEAAKEKPRLFSVWGSGPNDIWIGGNGTILHIERKAS